MRQIRLQRASGARVRAENVYAKLANRLTTVRRAHLIPRETRGRSRAVASGQTLERFAHRCAQVRAKLDFVVRAR